MGVPLDDPLNVPLDVPLDVPQDVPLDVSLDVPWPLSQVIPLGPIRANSHFTAAQDMKQFLLASLIGEESLLNLMTHGLAGVLGKIGLCSAV